MRKYTTLLIDADETLLDFPAAEKTSLKRVCEQFEIEFSDSFLQAFSDINRALWKQHEKGLVTKEIIKIRRFEQLADLLSLSADPQKMAKLYVSSLTECSMILEGADRLCERLSEHYELYIVTNGIASVQKGRIGGCGLLPYFNGVFISEETGSQKPEKRFFEYVFDHINEKNKSKICIIGDSMSSDILGGINAGIDTCFYNPKGAELTYTPTYHARSYDELTEIFSV